MPEHDNYFCLEFWVDADEEDGVDQAGDGASIEAVFHLTTVIYPPPPLSTLQKLATKLRNENIPLPKKKKVSFQVCDKIFPS